MSSPKETKSVGSIIFTNLIFVTKVGFYLVAIIAATYLYSFVTQGAPCTTDNVTAQCSVDFLNLEPLSLFAVIFFTILANIAGVINIKKTTNLQKYRVVWRPPTRYQKIFYLCVFFLILPIFTRLSIVTADFLEFADTMTKLEFFHDLVKVYTAALIMSTVLVLNRKRP